MSFSRFVCACKWYTSALNLLVCVIKWVWGTAITATSCYWSYVSNSAKISHKKQSYWSYSLIRDIFWEFYLNSLSCHCLSNRQSNIFFCNLINNIKQPAEIWNVRGAMQYVFHLFIMMDLSLYNVKIIMCLNYFVFVHDCMRTKLNHKDKIRFLRM